MSKEMKLQEGWVVKEEYTESKLAKLDDWMFDHIWGYAPVWRFCRNYLNPFIIKRKIRYFFQRLFRGFDDSETWSLDDTFYKWLLPRLKRFAELTCGYPEEYKTFDQWKRELDARVKQLEEIVNIEDDEFTDYKYIPKTKLKELLKGHGTQKDIVNMFAKDYCVLDFNKWFAKRINHLWW